MENVSDIHFSKCECSGGYDDNPYDSSPELKDSEAMVQHLYLRSLEDQEWALQH